MHPAPEVEARLAEPEELPPTVRAILKAAEGGEWQAYATYARGTKLPLTPKEAAKPRVVMESVALKAWRGDERVLGVWVRGPIVVPMRLAWSFEAAWSWTVVDGAIPADTHRTIGATELKALVTT